MAKLQPAYMPWSEFKSSSPRSKYMVSDEFRSIRKSFPRRKSGEFTFTLICDGVVGSKRKGAPKLTDAFPHLKGQTIKFERNQDVTMDIDVGIWLEEFWVNSPAGRRAGF